tara:strand:- start:7313 stop:7861 length:549 start_codon:yes stop_codon:yes gene_type:complete
MASTLEIIQGIAQAAANAYDGSHVESIAADGRARTVGLKREEGDLIRDRRVMDGFGIQFRGDLLRITYQAELQLKEVHGNDFENDIARMLQNIAQFLKREYKVIRKENLTLTKQGDPDIIVQKISNVRSDVQAYCDYKIGGLGDVLGASEASSADRLDDAIKNFLSQGHEDAKKPQNVTRKD